MAAALIEGMQRGRSVSVAAEAPHADFNASPSLGRPSQCPEHLSFLW